MHTTEQENELSSLMKQHGFEFRGVQSREFRRDERKHSFLLFEKSTDDGLVALEVDIEKSSLNMTLKNLSVTIGVHSYDGIKKFIPYGVPNDVDRLRRRSRGEPVDD